MVTLNTDAMISEVAFTRDRLILTLANGYRAKLPLSRFPALAQAQVPQRESWQLQTQGAQVRWPELELTLSKDDLLGAR